MSVIETRKALGERADSTVRLYNGLRKLNSDHKLLALLGEGYTFTPEYYKRYLQSRKHASYGDHLDCMKWYSKDLEKAIVEEACKSAETPARKKKHKKKTQIVYFA